MYDPGEKPDASFAAHHLGGDKSEYDAVNSNEFIDGDSAAWNTMFAIARSGLASDATYAQHPAVSRCPGLHRLHDRELSTRETPTGLRTIGPPRAGAWRARATSFSRWDAEWTFSDETQT